MLAKHGRIACRRPGLPLCLDVLFDEQQDEACHGDRGLRLGPILCGVLPGRHRAEDGLSFIPGLIGRDHAMPSQHDKSLRGATPYVARPIPDYIGFCAGRRDPEAEAFELGVPDKIASGAWHRAVDGPLRELRARQEIAESVL